MDNLIKLIDTSPFSFQEGAYLSCMNTKKNISRNEFEDIAIKGIINPVDFYILELLFQYKLLNRHNIEFGINLLSPLGDGLKKKDYKKNMSKLVRLGAVLRYHLLNPDNLPASSPCFYMLSSSISKLMQKKRNKPVVGCYPTDLINSSCHTAMKLLSTNQAVLRLSYSYSSLIEKISIFNRYTLLSSHLMLEGLIRMKTMPNTTLIFLLIIKRNDSWIHEYVDKLKALHSITEISKYRTFRKMIITLCEDDMQIRNASQVIIKSEFTLPVYLTTDTSIIHNSFHALYMPDTESENDSCTFKIYSLDSILCH